MTALENHVILLSEYTSWGFYAEHTVFESVDTSVSFMINRIYVFTVD